MATITTLVNRVKIFAASTGSGPFTLGPAVGAFKGSEALLDGHRYSYAVEQGNDYEYGTAEYVLSTNSLVRSPEGSSRGGAPVPFAANAQIAFTALAEDYTYGDAAALRQELADTTGAGMIGIAGGGSVQDALDAAGGGTVTVVTASIDSTGTDAGVDVTNGTTAPAIALHFPNASEVNRGLLSSADFTVFSGKATAGAVGSSGLTMSTARLLGRWSASTGAVQEVTVSTGLSLSGSGVLTATAGSPTWGSITGTLSAQSDLQTALTARALTGAIGSSGITQNTGKLLGRWSASAGAVQEVTISTGLALDGSGNLTATAGSGTVTSVQASGGTTGLTFSGGPVTGSGTLTMAGTLAVTNGGTGGTTAALGRTGLGATTVGANIFTLTNPSAVTFLRMNADNSVTALSAAAFVTAIGAQTALTSGTNIKSINGVSLLASGDLDARASALGSQSANYTLVLADANGIVYHPSTDNNARVFTIPANASVAFPIGTMVTFINDAATSCTIAITTDTLAWSPAGTTGTRTIAANGMATAVKVTSTRWLISGTGLT